VAQLDSDKCQGLVGTLGTRFMNQGDTWKPLSLCHVSNDINYNITLGDLNLEKHSSLKFQISEVTSSRRSEWGVGAVDPLVIWS
jgi:hypothetical protein